MDIETGTLLYLLQVTLLIIVMMIVGWYFTSKELNRIRRHTFVLRRRITQDKKKLKDWYLKSLEIKSQEKERVIAPPPPVIEVLTELLNNNSHYFREKYPKQDIEQYQNTFSDEAKLLAIRHIFLNEELYLRQHTQKELDYKVYIKNLVKLTESILQNSEQNKLDEQTPNPLIDAKDDTDDEQLNEQIERYKNYVKQSRASLKTLIIRLSELTSLAINEEHVELILEELNNSMECFARISGFEEALDAIDIEGDPADFKKTYEQGMSLLELIDSIDEEAQDSETQVEAALNATEKSKALFESSTENSEAFGQFHKKLHSQLKLARVANNNYKVKLSSTKEMLTEFLERVKAFQDQTSRLTILQSKEKELQKDLSNEKLQIKKKSVAIECRDVQLMALHKKFVESNDSDMIENLVQLTNEIYSIESEVAELRKFSGDDKKIKELEEKREAIEKEVMNVMGF